jgi:hypothetical protein
VVSQQQQAQIVLADDFGTWLRMGQVVNGELSADAESVMANGQRETTSQIVRADGYGTLRLI